MTQFQRVNCKGEKKAQKLKLAVVAEGWCLFMYLLATPQCLWDLNSQPGTKLTLPAWKGRVLTTGPLRNSIFFKKFILNWRIIAFALHFDEAVWNFTYSSGLWELLSQLALLHWDSHITWQRNVLCLQIP